VLAGGVLAGWLAVSVSFWTWLDTCCTTALAWF